MEPCNQRACEWAVIAAVPPNRTAHHTARVRHDPARFHVRSRMCSIEVSGTMKLHSFGCVKIVNVSLVIYWFNLDNSHSDSVSVLLERILKT